jgi:hypothetical protein
MEGRRKREFSNAEGRREEEGKSSSVVFVAGDSNCQFGSKPEEGREGERGGRGREKAEEDEDEGGRGVREGGRVGEGEVREIIHCREVRTSRLLIRIPRVLHEARRKIQRRKRWPPKFSCVTVYLR